MRIIVLVCMLLLGACSGKTTLPPLSDNAAILAFGDSLTAGIGASKGNSYPDILSHLSSLNVINAGVSGETTDEGLKRLGSLLDQEAPDLLILIEGGNDILRNKKRSDTKRNLGLTIQQAQQRSIPVVLVGVPEKSVFSYSSPIYEELAEEYDLVYEDSLIGGLMRDSSMKSDPIHFNDAGYRKMAEALYELLSDRGAL